MTFPLEYHKTVRRSIPASLALSAMLLLPLLLLSTGSAQITSSASSGGGHAAGGTASSVTSIGHNYAPPHSGVTFPTHPPHSPSPPVADGRRPHHSANGQLYYPYVYAVPVPYAVNDGATDNDNDDDDDAEYQGGPTIFDRRGSGAASYVPPSSSGPAHALTQAEQAQTDYAPEPPPIPTTLVFKDTHQLEIENYAIVNQTLYDLTPGHPRKIALADLDLPATEKQNDDRGITFQLPPSAQVN